ncbi:MAG: lipoprotein [Betaproteobacteria bacterium]|nr:lipoprotein [Betaproteobacteria bacterium]
MNSARLLLLATLAAVVLAISGCGRSGDLYLPEQPESQAPQ